MYLDHNRCAYTKTMDDVLTHHSYVIENQETGESGWMLSGAIAGGMTVGGWPVNLFEMVYGAVRQAAEY